MSDFRLITSTHVNIIFEISSLEHVSHDFDDRFRFSVEVFVLFQTFSFNLTFTPGIAIGLKGDTKRKIGKVQI